ncbi:hypothetical protein [Pantoea sp. Ep11b]|uniref:hypothetical protein n=1 Tax=Pantoea sp. Ep11b TaxID=3141459 RepID=UPI00345FE129
MSNNPGQIYCFTAEMLRDHDLEIATKVTQATATHVIRKMNQMTTGQQLRSGTKRGRQDMMLSEDALEKILTTVSKN